MPNLEHPAARMHKVSVRTRCGWGHDGQEDTTFITSHKGTPHQAPALKPLQVLQLGFSTQLECYALDVRQWVLPVGTLLSPSLGLQQPHRDRTTLPLSPSSPAQRPLTEVGVAGDKPAVPELTEVEKQRLGLCPCAPGPCRV